jgi:phage-related protein
VALTIGELVGMVTLDTTGMDDGLNRAETQMRQLGTNISGTATTAGETAGSALGDGIAQGAETQLRNAQGELVTAGTEAGESFSGGLESSASEGGEKASEDVKSKFDKLKTGIAGAGLAAGGALMAAFGEAMDQQNIVAKMGVQMGATPAVAQRYGKIAGSLYSTGLTEDFQSAADAISATMGAGLLPPTATNAQIQSISGNVSNLASTFGQDLGGVTNAVSQMLRTGLAPNAKAALDILTVGFQSSANKADDLLDTFNEYGTQFRKAGLDGATAVGLMNQAIQGGARDSDLAADAIKEFSIRAVDGSKTTKDGFAALGLNATDMATKFSKGGKSASAALDTTLDRLRNMKDPVKQSATATKLFGTQAEDLGAALYKMDPSTAAKGIGKVGGAADKMGKQLSASASVKVEAFKRSLTQGLVNVMGNQVIPILMKVPGFVQKVATAFQTAAGFIDRNKTAFITIGSIITTIMLPTLIQLGVQATIAAAKSVAAFAAQAAGAVSAAAKFVVSNITIIAGWVAQGAAAAAAAIRTVAAWVLMGAQAMLQAARMAAAWLLAMGPIPIIIALVIGLVALIIANWDTIKSWTLAAWDWVWNKIKEVAQFLLDLFMNWTLVGLIISHWDAIKSATSAAWEVVKNAVMVVVNAILATVTAVWGALKTATLAVWNAIKTAASATWNFIKSVITTQVNGAKAVVSAVFNAMKSLITTTWNGIKSVTSSVWGAIKSTITTLVNGAKSAVSSAINTIKSAFSSGFNAVKSTVSNAISSVVNVIKGLGGKVKSAITGAGTWLVNAGKSIIQGLINGIKGMAGNVTSAVKGVLSSARKLLPFSPAKTGPFSGKGWTLYSGRSIMEAMATGINQRSGQVSDAVKGAMATASRHQLALGDANTPIGTIQSTAPSAVAAAGSGGSGAGLAIENYYESNNGSASDTATELEWLARTRR